ncbi:MAG TPA: hypothetical protein PLD88_11600, partial [Candidatus Berkiella sp.]|nr:hypothetical protein [Candidatus Berkiella sp.]
YDLVPGKAYYLDKAQSSLSRNLSVLRNNKGEYKLIVETKSKLANGQKQKLPLVEGGYKKGKPAWRVDTEEEHYFSLITHINSEQDYN